MIDSKLQIGFHICKKKKKGCCCSILVITEDRFCLMKAKNEDLRNKGSPEITNRFKKHVYVLTYF